MPLQSIPVVTGLAAVFSPRGHLAVDGPMRSQEVGRMGGGRITLPPVGRPLALGQELSDHPQAAGHDHDQHEADDPSHQHEHDHTPHGHAPTSSGGIGPVSIPRSGPWRCGAACTRRPPRAGPCRAPRTNAVEAPPASEEVYQRLGTVPQRLNSNRQPGGAAVAVPVPSKCRRASPSLSEPDQRPS